MVHLHQPNTKVLPFNSVGSQDRRSGKKTYKEVIAMDNELKDICERLEGWSVEKNKWFVQSAEKLQDGTWRINIKNVKPEAKK